MNHFSFVDGTPGTLSQANAIISSAVSSWPAPERLIRRSIPVLQYMRADLIDFDYAFCIHRNRAVAVAFWIIDQDNRQIDLHGLYTAANWQGLGAGQALQEYLVRTSQNHKLDSVHVKAHKHSRTYFEKQGYLKSEGTHTGEIYPYRYVKPIVSFSCSMNRESPETA